MIAMMESTIIQLRTFVWVSTSGKNGNEKRIKPYVPIFKSTPARMTEPAVGASVCASGSQVWNGNIGTLMANAKKKPQKRYCWKRVENCGTAASSVGISNVYAAPVT